MKKVLLLGGFGFIGTNLLKLVEKKGIEDYKFIIFDKFEQHPHKVNFTNIDKIYAGDFSDVTLIEKIFKENDINIVLHFLSSTIPASSSNARYDVESNLIPSLNLLDIMEKYHVKDIVYMSSGGAIYGDTLLKVHNENDAVYPKSSYGVVKLAIEKYLLSYSELYGFNTLILRLSNPFGPYHYNNKQGVINIAIRKALAGETFQIWGSGEGVKDYIYILDACDIILRLIANGVYTDVINVAASNALSVSEIVEYIKREIPTFTTEHVEASTLDVQSFELDITRLRNKLKGFRMTLFGDALKETIKWQENEGK